MRCYSHLSDDEREQIGLAKALGHSIGAIAQAIGRPKSTVCANSPATGCRAGATRRFTPPEPTRNIMDIRKRLARQGATGPASAAGPFLSVAPCSGTLSGDSRSAGSNQAMLAAAIERRGEPVPMPPRVVQMAQLGPALCSGAFLSAVPYN